MKVVCSLCLNPDDLRLSHIVPGFVWRWLKETAPGGMRTNRKPNQRVQDGPKDYLLCDACEQRFSKWEKAFCERIFLPLHHPEPVIAPIRYEDWALKFAVSVSWRVLTFFKSEGANDHLTLSQHELATQAVETWRRFLLEEIESPGRFDQHLLPTDVIEDYSGQKISPYLNRYLLRNVHIDLVAAPTSAYVYTKMCRLILFGRIHEEHPQLWDGMELNLKQGEIRPRDYCMPRSIAIYMNDKADEVKRVVESTSPRQHKIIRSEFEKNVDAIANSEVFRAMKYDVAHSGKEAFSKRKQKD